MTPDELLSIAGAIMGRFQAYYSISLTQHQAMMVYRLEMEETIVLHDNHPSEWEEYDWRLDGLSRILRDDQLAQFKSSTEKQLRQLELSKIEGDKAQLHQVRYEREILEFFTKSVHKTFFDNEKLFQGLDHPDYKGKIAFLKAEYSRFLDQAHRRAIINHYRYQRNFMPNALEALRLRNKKRHVEPDYGYFYHQMDTPTKAVADFIFDKLNYLPSLEAGFYTGMQNKIFEFYENLNRKYLNPPSSLSVTYRVTKERELKSWTMTLLLLEKEKYRVDSKW